eukprot:Gb_04728 [translate_table: standard]
MASSSSSNVQATDQNSTMAFNQEILQQRLQILVETDAITWTYAIFWQVSYDAIGTVLLGWGDGYYKGPRDPEEEERLKRRSHMTVSPAERELRKKVLRDLHALISGNDEPTLQESSNTSLDEEVTDAEWFYLVSMMQSFVSGYGVPGLALSSGAPVWLMGPERLQGSNCDRAKQAQELGIQSMVCVPVRGGVVEFGSRDLIAENWSPFRVISREKSRMNCEEDVNAWRGTDSDAMKIPQKKLKALPKPNIPANLMALYNGMLQYRLHNTPIY